MSERQDEALRLASALIDDIELLQTSTARRIMRAQRIARLTENSTALEWISFELNGSLKSGATSEWMTRTGRWTDKANGVGYRVSAADLEATRDSLALKINGYSAPMSLAGDYVNIALSNQRKALSASVGELNSINKILAKVDQQVYAFALETYNELKFSQVQSSLFEAVKLAVDAELSGTTGDALKLIDGIAERLGSGDAVALSQAMTTCRQLIDTVADRVFAPSDTPYVVADGTSLEVKADKVKNRLNAYVDKCGVRGNRAKRIGKSLNEIYSRVSTSVHNYDSVGTREAQYLFLGTYLILGEIITLSGDPDDMREL